MAADQTVLPNRFLVTAFLEAPRELSVWSVRYPQIEKLTRPTGDNVWYEPPQRSGCERSVAGPRRILPRCLAWCCHPAALRRAPSYDAHVTLHLRSILIRRRSERENLKRTSPLGVRSIFQYRP